ncbi:lipid droplet-associated protein [Gordonia sp. UBA7599]|uniref:lipid droplet-associated protein n=1 Tax=Gordonia sp. UBA7599 TaxID=1946578 RepID=UPI0025BC0A9E|nr:lipid droplet-associated protein [Gordonia sp. UBA7599]
MAQAPYGIRLLVGVAVTAIEETRKLPQTIVMYPMTFASTIAQLVMKVQQDLAGFAIKGDAALEMVFPPKEEKPDWATFDEDDEPEPETPTANGERATEGRFALYSVTDPPGRTAGARAATGAKKTAEEPAKPAAEPPAIAGELDYDSLTLAQLRARIQSLTVADLRALLAYEESAKARAPFQTLLANRITRATAK